MAIGVQNELTKIAVVEESTEGTAEAPSSGTDGYIQPVEGGFTMSGSKETVERTILTTGFFKARDRVGKKSVEWTLNVEMRASGTEGAQPDFHPLLKNMLGGSRSVGARDAVESGSTATTLNMTGHSFTAGDCIVLLEPGAHSVHAITATTTDDVTILPAAPGAPTDGTEVSQCQTYFGSNTASDYSSLTLNYYRGDEIAELGLGCRPNSLAVSNFTTGGIAQFDFSGTGIDFSRADGSSPYTPDYDDALPPLILSSCIYRDGTQVDINNLSLTIEHDNGELPSTCAESGVLSTRKVGKRRVAGSFDPYLDDADVSLFTKFTQNTAYSLFAFAATPSTTAGEIDLGSVVCFYLPNCISTSDTVQDLEGILQTAVEFTSDGGEAGESNEIFIGLV